MKSRQVECARFIPPGTDPAVTMHGPADASPPGFFTHGQRGRAVPWNGAAQAALLAPRPFFGAAAPNATSLSPTVRRNSCDSRESPVERASIRAP